MTVKFLIGTQEVVLPACPGQTILEVLQADGQIRLHTPCGGAGICEKCTVYLCRAEGETAVPACRTPVRDAMTVRLPETVQTQVLLPEQAGMPLLHPDKQLSGYGIACDIGTTTVVCCLIEKSSGLVLGSLGQDNAQRIYGADVISRIKAWTDGYAGQLTGGIVKQLSDMICTLCAENQIDPAQVGGMTVAANTTMCHLLVGLSPEGIGTAPFVPASFFGTEYDAGGLGLPISGKVYLAPAVSGYVGGDITAGALAVGMDKKLGSSLLLDIGTNGELLLAKDGAFTCCATAAGPVFEGAGIRHGMAAAKGAISAVALEDGSVSCTVIGGGQATGLCGSGLVDAVAAMLELGVLDETGRLMDPEEDEMPAETAALLTEVDGQPAFRLADGIVVTQQDVRKVQLGKGAIAAGIRVLLEEQALDAGQIDELLLAGGFGSQIRPESAVRIGLIPAQRLSVTRAVGNTAAQGAQLLLTHATARENLEQLAQQTRYIELSGLPAFHDAYMEAMFFPEEGI